MAEKQGKLCQINARLTEEDRKMIQDKAKEANLSVSDFIRTAAAKVTINRIYNGGEIVQELQSCHNDMRNYNNNISQKLETLSKLIEQNSELLKAHPVSTSPEFKETFSLQKAKMNTLILHLLDKQKDHELEVEARLHNIYEGLR